MNIFFAPLSQIQEGIIELQGQEAAHASKVLRYKRGDDIVTVDGVGGWYEGKVQTIFDETVRIAIDKSATERRAQPQVMLGVGIIKKRDRLEFAVEKAVELGVKEIAVFRGDQSVKQNVRPDRLKSTALAAMKQSLRAWLPAVNVYESLNQMIDAYPSASLLVAYQNKQPMSELKCAKHISHPLLMVGPEGGFSEAEISFFKENDAQFASLSNSRLRTETAAITSINQFKACVSS